jgi:hypothetical protein
LTQILAERLEFGAQPCDFQAMPLEFAACRSLVLAGCQLGLKSRSLNACSRSNFLELLLEAAPLRGILGNQGSHALPRRKGGRLLGLFFWRCLEFCAQFRAFPLGGLKLFHGRVAFPFGDIASVCQFCDFLVRLSQLERQFRAPRHYRISGLANGQKCLVRLGQLNRGVGGCSGKSCEPRNQFVAFSANVSQLTIHIPCVLGGVTNGTIPLTDRGNAGLDGMPSEPSFGRESIMRCSGIETAEYVP